MNRKKERSHLINLFKTIGVKTSSKDGLVKAPKAWIQIIPDVMPGKNFAVYPLNSEGVVIDDIYVANTDDVLATYNIL